jgi:hypothetical protein
VEGSGRGLISDISKYLPAATEENQQQCTVSPGPRKSVNISNKERINMMEKITEHGAS